MDLEFRDLQDLPWPRELLRRAVAETCRTVAVGPDEISIVLVDDDRIQELNRRFRGMDRPTDVISFEPEAVEDRSAAEIVVSVETAARQAAGAGHGLETELAWLVVHGVLHVSGMTDETEDGLHTMMDLQRAVLARLGLEIKL